MAANYFTDESESDLFMNESVQELMDSQLSKKCIQFCEKSNDCFGEIFELTEIRKTGPEGISQF